MPQVKVRSRGVSADDTAAVIRAALGDGLEIVTVGDRELEVRRGYFGRARVSIAEEPGGTVFGVRWLGPPLPLLMLTARAMGNFGIARQVAAAIDQHAGFRDA
jgi:hypothetical protein